MTTKAKKARPETEPVEVTAIERWHGIPYKGKTHWWTRKLSDGSWLAVNWEKRGQWRWRHRGPGYVGEPGNRTSRVRAEGHAPSAMRAKDLADAYLSRGVAP